MNVQNKKLNININIAFICFIGIATFSLTGCNDDGNKLSSIDTSPTTVGKDPEKKVLVIGIDGLMYDYIDDIDNEEMNEPALQHFPRLTLTKALTGGYLGTQSHQVSSSGPAWSSILTGTWVDGHTITSNNNQAAKTPTIFEHLYNADNGIDMASFAAWSPINTGHANKGMSLVKQRIDGSATPSNMSVDEFITEKLVNELKDDDSNLDFIFVHLDEIDGAGHSCGWCVTYEEKLVETDTRLGQILDTIDYRQSNFNEEWLVMIVSDHGHVKTGGHGGNSIEERTSVIGTNKPELMNELFATSSSEFNLVSEAQNTLMGYPGITTIAPTVLNYLNYDVNTEHHFSSPSLIGEIGIKNAYIQIEQTESSSAIININWRAASNIETISIFRDGEKIKEVSAGDELFQETISINSLSDGEQHLAYTLVPNKGNSLTTWAQFTLGKEVAIDDILNDVISHVGFQGNHAPFTFVANNASSPVYDIGPFNEGKAIRISRDEGYLTTPMSFQDIVQGTFGFWLKVNGEITGDPNVIANKDWNSGSNPGFTIAITNSSLKFNIGDGSGRADTQLEYSRGEWIFVIASFDFINKEIALYVNDATLGFQEAKVAAPNVSSLVSEFPLNIVEGGDGNYNMNNTIDISVADLLFFNRTLTNSEVRSLSSINSRVPLQ